MCSFEFIRCFLLAHILEKNKRPKGPVALTWFSQIHWALCGVFFFSTKFYIYIWHWQLWNNYKIFYLCKRKLHCLKGCTISNVNVSRAVLYNNKIILNLCYIFLYYMYSITYQDSQKARFLLYKPV